MGFVPWEYFTRVKDPMATEAPGDGSRKEIWTGETGIQVFLDNDNNDISFNLLTRSSFADNTSWNKRVLKFYMSFGTNSWAICPPISCVFAHVITAMAKHFAVIQISVAKVHGEIGSG